MTRKFLFAAIAIIIFLAAIYLYRHKSGTKTTLRLNKPNILLITIDTIRPDYVSCYGGSNSTPHIDSIAKSGILFENTYSSVPLTFPSHTSILSGLFPSSHGMHNNGLEILSRQDILIGSQLKKYGYQTGAVVSSFVLDRKFGLEKSFDVYDDSMERKPGLFSNFEVERPGNEVTNHGIKILENFTVNPWFLWLHYYDPHTPHSPPAPYVGYGGEIQFVDSQIGKIFDWLKANDKNKNLVIAIIGDHGESLGEHGEETHGFFTYNSTLRIPFVLTFPGAPANLHVTENTASVDLVPTLLDLIGFSDPISRDGESILPFLNGMKRHRDIYFESRYPELFGWNGLQGLVREDWKLISTTRSELYNLKNDPKEKQNLFSQNQNVSTKLKEELSVRYAKSNETQHIAPDAETLEKLRSLGYVGSTNLSSKKGTADPKDKIAVWSKYERATLLKEVSKEETLKFLEDLSREEPENNFFRVALASHYRENKKFDLALELLKEAVRIDPVDENAYQNLALTYKDLRNYPEALKAQQASLAIDPNRSDAQGFLGMLLVDTGHFEKAQSQFVKVLKIDPNNAVAWNNYGNALRETGKFEEAKKAYQESTRLSPNYAYPLNGLATILIKEDHTADAIPYLEKAIDLDPTFVEVYLNLGIAYHTLGQTDKARTLYKAFLKLSPDWMSEERKNAQILLNQIS
jgi:choline-sulfatase